jgi:hypothetical protein
MKTNELIGPALDWAVALCEGYVGDRNSWLHEATLEEVEDGSFHPSSNWEQGGQIIEREKITVSQSNDIMASIFRSEVGYEFKKRGPTPLVAAMRTYVASKLGDEVEIPKELL